MAFRNPPGIFPALDMQLGQTIVAINNMKGLDKEITALKIAGDTAEEYGMLTMRGLFADIGSEFELCYDRQKGATDVPFKIRQQVQKAAKYGFGSYIGNPLGSGSNPSDDPKAMGSLEAFVDECDNCRMTPIIVLEMTQPGAIAFSSQVHCENLARRAIDLGVEYFVAPATKPERISVYRSIIGSDRFIISPGAGPQKSWNAAEDAANAIRHGADYVVIGRAIYTAPDPIQAAKYIFSAISEEYDKR